MPVTLVAPEIAILPGNLVPLEPAKPATSLQEEIRRRNTESFIQKLISPSRRQTVAVPGEERSFPDVVQPAKLHG